MPDLVSVQEGDSFEHWHEVTCRNYSVTQCRPPRSKGFSATVSGHALGRLVMSEIASSITGETPLRVTRSASDARKDGRDDFLLWLARAGSVTFEQQDRSVRLVEGDLMLHDQAYPFSLAFSKQSASTMVTIPRDFLMRWLPQAERMVALRLPGDSAVGRLSSLAIRELSRRIPDISASTADRLGSGAMQIWAAAFDETFHPCHDTARDGKLHAAMRYMLERLHDVDICTESVARHINVSNRTLLRIFALEGTTPMRWLWSQRLAASHAYLKSGKARNVTEVALTYGFRGLSHFCRSYKSVYGVSAGEAMRRFC